MTSHKKTSIDTIVEFFNTCRSSYSYNIFRNSYIWFGFLWGLPIPIVVASVYLNAQSEVLSLEAILQLIKTNPYFNFYLFHPFLFGLVFGVMGSMRKKRDDEIEELIKKLRNESDHDPLTSLENRRSFNRHLASEIDRSRREDEVMAVAMFDLDNFKKINDTYGHALGDEILVSFAKILTAQSRRYDIVSRWGGEEFVIVFPETPIEFAEKICDRVRLLFEKQIYFHNNEHFSCTVSAGVADLRDSFQKVDIINKADKALYAAKKSGKNKVLVFNDEMIND